VAVDDTSRLAYVEILDDERAPTCVGFLRRAVAWFAAHGVTVRRVMTDNGPGYRSSTHARTVTDLGIRHLRTRPYRPRTNGKAERFIQTLQAEWAYAAAYQDHWHRRRALLPWLEYDNRRRPNSALGHKPPVSLLHTDERSKDLQLAPSARQHTRWASTARQRARERAFGADRFARGAHRTGVVLWWLPLADARTNWWLVAPRRAVSYFVKAVWSG
jgi:hypothetical protein